MQILLLKRIVRCCVFACVASTLLMPLRAHATVEFSTFDPGDAYQSEEGKLIGGQNQYFGYGAAANEFTAAFTGTMTSVDVAVFGLDTTGNNIQVVLYQNDPLTHLPLTTGVVMLGTVTAPKDAAAVETVTIPTAEVVPLIGGMSYWLALLPADGDTADAWAFADNTFATTAAYTKSSTSPYMILSGTASAFDINAVPEPSTWGLMIIGTGAMLTAARQRVRAF